MDEIYIGLAVVVVVVLTIKTMNTYHNYKNTIYPQVYSGFIEFLYRKASEKRLSSSSWLESKFGFHRILYYVDESNHKRFKKLFVIIILSSGIYVINSKNLKGRIYLDKGKKYKYVTSFVNKETKEYGNKAVDLPNPVLEVDNFADKVSQITRVNQVHKIIQFLDDTTIEINNPKIPMICSHDFFVTIESLHTQNENQFTDLEIEQLYTKLHKKFN